MLSVVSIIAGLLTVIFGFYLFDRKDGVWAVLGGLFSITGLSLFIYGVLNLTVPGFFG